MKKNWEVKKLGEVCQVIAGQSPESKHYNKAGSGLPFYQGKKDFTEKFIGDPTVWTTKITKQAEQGDILMSVRAPVGPVNISTNCICIGRGLAAIRVSKIIDREFLFNFLLKYESEITGNTGAVFDSINKQQIEKILLPLPPLPEQQRIVSILDESFVSIAKAKENAEKNLQNAQELFESYLQSVFANPGDDWEEKELGDKNVLEIIDGDRGKNYPKQSDFLSDGFCLFLNTKNVRPDGFEFHSTMFINVEKDNALGKGKLNRNDVVMTTRGTIGNLGIYCDDVKYENIRINSGMLIFRPNLKVITPKYLFEVLRSGVIKFQINSHVSGAAQPQLPIKTLVNFSIPVPKSLEVQNEIVSKLNALSHETRNLESIYQQKLADLEELKKSILQKAFNGEL
ncbi:MAG: restriction endonuclease subunit S [Dethiobacter sp.]|jgi:type I restriction enzyme S subunit|nr:restriction endonuclease subunit S [Dethiobacter sp.]